MLLLRFFSAGYKAERDSWDFCAEIAVKVDFMRCKQTLKNPNVGSFRLQRKNMGVCWDSEWQINAIDTNKCEVIPTSERMTLV